MSDVQLEQMIQSKGLNAPRVTLERINGLITAEYYVTGDKATMGCPQCPSLALLTLCILVLRNGTTVVGTSACVSPENFDAEVGQRAARNKAVDQVWALEGYLLRQQLHDAPASKPLT